MTDPDASLPKGWQSSGDRAVTTTGDSSGFRILVADSSQAYQWRTVASLSEPGFDTDMWIGNSCVTGSGKRAAVVYAPRQFTNQPQLMQRGAFAAIVDLESGAVTKLPDQVSLAYFDPGCGADENVVFTQNGDADLGRTRVLTIDAATGKPVRAATVAGQLTSAVPVGDAVVGAAGGQLTKVDAAGRTSVLATTSGAASSVHPDAQGGVTFLDHQGDTAVAKRLAQGKVSTLAEGRTGDVGVQSGSGGRVFLTGKPKDSTTLPAEVQQLPVPADATVSTQGSLAIDQAVSARVRTLADNPLAATGSGEQGPDEIQGEVPGTGKKLSFALTPPKPTPDTNAGAATSPALANAASATTPPSTKTPAAAASRLAGPAVKASAVTASATSAGSPTSTIDDDRACAVPRNDPSQQAYQPTPAQVEWAADMAVRGDLTSNWINQGGWRALDGLGTVNPQGMFPLPSLNGAPTGHIPPQVLLGVLTQESNLWQAEGGAIPGQFSSPLTGNFYGHPRSNGDPNQDPWAVNWGAVDCGYGMGQQTDGMHSANQLRPGDQAWPADQQKAVALDYASNIAVAAQTLATKWNELHDPNAPMKLNSDNPASIENWFTAAWDYNAGFTKYNPANPSAPWGLGYLNNPANPLYQVDRQPFLNFNHYADAAHPQLWPYEEKVLGWAAWPINTGRSYDNNGNLNHGNTAGYAAAWWDNDAHRTLVKPPLDTFCNTQNNCDATKPPRCEVDHLGPDCDTPYWWHSSTAWKTCDVDCGHETMTYKTLRMEPGNGTTGAPDCAGPGAGYAAVPAGALVIDSVSGAVPPMRADCTRTWTNAGTLSFNFQQTQGTYEAKSDLHQIGGGFGAHFWYAHTRNGSNYVTSASNDITKPTQATGPMAITGTWQLGQPLNAWTKVAVHIPDSGSQTRQAIYTIHLGDGTTENRIVNANSNTNQWVSLGVFNFAATGNDIQGVELSNFTQDGTGASGDDIAWDAAYFQPLPAKPTDFVVAMGDSYSSGEGTGSYYYNTDVNGANNTTRDDCHRSPLAWSRQGVLPDSANSIGTRADTGDSTMDYHLIACGGARSHNILSVQSPPDAFAPPGKNDSGSHENGEFAQLDQGYLDANTTLVTLSIGGNDARFSSVVMNCILNIAFSDCAATTLSGDTAPLGQAEPSVINSQVHDSVLLDLQEIHKRAPNARIVLMGYPPLFENHGNCLQNRLNSAVITAYGILGPLGAGVAGAADIAASVHIGPDADWMDQIAFTLNSALGDAAGVARQSGIPVTFSDPTAVFAGKAICGSPQSINDFVLTKAAGENPSNPVSGQSFHPTANGATLYGQALTQTLNSTGK
ncbi:SGNH/GDSL hydrolase family protein [Kitasatospora sp. NBC_01250]|uniref:golvesin C-terminal-like domain-containing protein n=1 Tax=Kitasatospora sp. NBC_01250 TaxID=2903571 RepID=UPI002E338C53|nr:SGNH/GDSL hydrolase family protein [Kitasatospora sp. NBC_01250]